MRNSTQCGLIWIDLSITTTMYPNASFLSSPGLSGYPGQRFRGAWAREVQAAGGVWATVDHSDIRGLVTT